MIPLARAAGLACFAFLAACQPAARDGHASQAQSNVAARSVPLLAAGDAQQAVDPGKLLAENDRAIADNKWMIDALQGYARQDPAKLARLRTACQQKLGAPVDREGAARIFNCIRDTW
ncbi:hypothetical protein [Sphingomonas kyeonggiensis]|uniref:UrcA family protein n=1 Tax=Sphingomonas kyeonggiensis TaxID=1268553 RepID=A0A7W6NVJ9_9SPHN|nr:hypothetical protein [Sphingomonas kyeonggiensis]MBB4096639.1 hypothetical protein [Sphingomonas kyeonggiensis]